MGSTINLAKPGGVAWLISYILGMPLIIVVVSLVIMGATR
jgi:hypothetical protein